MISIKIILSSNKIKIEINFKNNSKILVITI